MTTLIDRLTQHIAMMAPHQHNREAGKLLVDAKDEIETLRAALTRMNRMHGLMMANVNHKASFYDAECIQEMNGAPLEAARALRPNV